MSFKGFSIFNSGCHFIQRNRTISSFGRGSPKAHFCEIFLKSVHIGLGGDVLLKVFLFLAQSFYSAERNNFSNFGSPKEHFCEIILKSVHWSRRRCLFKGFSIFCSGGHFVQLSGMILEILVEGH